MLHNLTRIFSQIDVDIGKDGDQIDIPQTELTPDTVEVVLQVVFGVIGAIAILIVVLAGMFFVLGRGNPEQSARARSAIIYALVGIAVSDLASAIIRFVAGRVG